MKTCPNCGEIVGDSVESCFKCQYNFVRRKVLSRTELEDRKIERAREQRIEREAEKRRIEEDEKRKSGRRKI